MFGHDHHKVSYKLRRMVANEEPRRDIARAIPRGYYPRLDDEEGRHFLLNYMRRYGDGAELLDTFIARGLDINEQIDAHDNGILHVLMRDSDRWGTVIETLVSNFRELDTTLRNTYGETPLDHFLRYGGGQYAERFVYDLMMREHEQMFEGSTQEKERTAHLHKRVVQLMEHLDGSELVRIIPAHLPLDLRDDKGRSLFMSLLEKGYWNSVRKVIAADDFKLPDVKEPVIEALIDRYGAHATEEILILAHRHGVPVSRDIVLRSVKTKSLTLVEKLCKRSLQKIGDAERREIFAATLKTCDVDFIKQVMAHELCAGFADIDAPVFDGGQTLLQTLISQGRVDDVQSLIAIGADIRKPDGVGEITRKLAENRGINAMITVIDQELARLNERGDFKRVHTSQLACKSGVLTYIFDFYAGQVVVRDEETKNIAATSFAEFAKSGSELLNEAATTLTVLGGNTHGFGAVNSLTPDIARKSASPISKKPSA